MILFSRTNGNEVKLLLGQEHQEEGFRDSNLWSGFEGGKKTNDATALDTCTRELAEETLAIFGSDCRTMCDENKHTLKIDMRLLDKRRVRQRLLYVVEVPMRDWASEFNTRRAALMQLHTACENYHSCDDKHVLRCGMVVDDGKQPRHTITDVSSVTYLDGHLTVQYVCSIGRARLVSATLPAVAEKQLQSFVQLKNIKALAARLNTTLRELAFTSGTAKVNTDFLEKSQIRYWTLNEVKHSDQLRAIFKPVVNVLLSRLNPANLQPNSSK